MTKTHTHKTFIVSAFKELAKEKNKSIKFFFKLANNKYTTRIRYSKVAKSIEILAVALNLSSKEILSPYYEIIKSKAGGGGRAKIF